MMTLEEKRMGADEQHTGAQLLERLKDLNTEVTWHVVAYVIVIVLR